MRMEAASLPKASLEPNTLTKNTSYITIALAIQKLVSFAYFAFLARRLGDENVGKYAYALALTSLFGIFIDFGLSAVLTREIAKFREKIRENLFRVTGMKIILAIFFVALIFPTVALLNGIRPIPSDTRLFIWLGIGIMLLDTATFTFYSVLRGLQRLQYEAIGILVYQTLIVAFGGISVMRGGAVIYVVLAILLGSVFHFLYSFTLLVRIVGVVPRPSWNAREMPKAIRIAAPFAIAGIFFKLSGTLDILMLGTLAGERYTGWYSTASKLMLALTVLPGGLATAYFPAMSKKLLESRDEARKMFEDAVRYLMIISLPITFGVLVIAKPLVVDVFKKDFEASGDALSVMVLGLVFLFVNYPVGNLLNAANRQVLNTINMGIALAVNAALNFWLIPERTFIGASISTLASMVLLTMLGLPWAKKIVHFRVWYLAREFIRITLVAALMGFVLYELRGDVHYALLILLGVVVYAPGLVLAGAVTSSELRSVVQKLTLRFAK